MTYGIAAEQNFFLKGLEMSKKGLLHRKMTLRKNYNEIASTWHRIQAQESKLPRVLVVNKVIAQSGTDTDSETWGSVSVVERQTGATLFSD